MPGLCRSRGGLSPAGPPLRATSPRAIAAYSSYRFATTVSGPKELPPSRNDAILRTEGEHHEHDRYGGQDTSKPPQWVECLDGGRVAGGVRRGRQRHGGRH